MSSANAVRSVWTSPPVSNWPWRRMASNWSCCCLLIGTSPVFALRGQLLQDEGAGRRLPQGECRVAAQLGSTGGRMIPPQTRVYHDGVVEAEGFPVADVSEHLERDGTVVWVDLCGPSAE